MASCAAHEGIKQRGRSARVCEAGVEAWMMGPGEQEDLEATNEPIEWLVRGEGESESESAYGEDEGDKSERREGTTLVVLHFGWEINFLQKCFILTRGVIDLGPGLAIGAPRGVVGVRYWSILSIQKRVPVLLSSETYMRG